MSQIAKLALLIFLTIFGFNSAYAAAEKGPKCSDGIDNDGDGFIDGDDPDCGGDGSVTGTTLVLKDTNGVLIGPVETDAAATYVFIPGAGKLARLQVAPLRVLPKLGALWWDMPGCTGNSYVPATTGSFAEEVKVIKLPGSTGDIFIVSDSTVEPMPNTRILSTSDDLGNCYPADTLTTVVPYVELTFDYTPPFSLDLR